jgi:hypothetical protein
LPLTVVGHPIPRPNTFLSKDKGSESPPRTDPEG